MPRRTSSNIRCSARGCAEKWIVVSKRRNMYCDKHQEESQREYDVYKDATSKALASLKSEDLERAACLREQWSEKFADRFSPAHLEFVRLLRRLINDPSNKDKKLQEFCIRFSPNYLNF